MFQGKFLLTIFLAFGHIIIIPTIHILVRNFIHPLFDTNDDKRK